LVEDNLRQYVTLSHRQGFAVSGLATQRLGLGWTLGSQSWISADYIHFGDNEPSLPISDIDISRITQSPIQVSEPTTIGTDNINDIDFSKPIDEDLPF
ncbi:MAG: hypothetical protein II604_00910, partial [Bacteroidales bacterium]|nr:hypothetical protein [Bacteroidales bacterium]